LGSFSDFAKNLQDKKSQIDREGERYVILADSTFTPSGIARYIADVKSRQEKQPKEL
jgi:precorrin-6B methylase 1